MGTANPTASLLLTTLEPARLFPPRRDGTMRKRVAFGSERAAQLNPLLSLVEDWMKEPGGYVEHLHQGFETVTLVFEGQVACADANGQRQVLSAGDIQWVTTGKGVMHAEMAQGEEEAHMVQLWLNLPAAQKLRPARSLTFFAREVPQAKSAGVGVRVIAGDFEGLAGAATAGSGACVLDLHLDAGATLELAIPAGQIGAAYLADGELSAGPLAARAGDVVHFTSKVSDRLRLTAATATHLVVVRAPPLDEPVVVNGPFIMNTAAQIQQAYADFRAGTFAAPEPASPGNSLTNQTHHTNLTDQS